MVRLNPDGSLDATFGDGGRLVDEGLDGAGLAEGVKGFGAQHLAVDAQGRIVAVGRLYYDRPGGGDMARAAVTRYNLDGSLDGTFGEGGRAVAGVEADWSSDVGVARDGRIVVTAGANEPHPDTGSSVPVGFQVARLNADGSIDETFGDGGRTTTRLVSIGFTQLELLDDGSVLVAGSHFNTPYDGYTLYGHWSAVARYRPDGTLDESFGDGGVLGVGDDGTNDPFYLRDVDAFADGSFVVVGGLIQSEDRPTNTAEMRRYTAAAKPATNFGDDGVVSIRSTQDVPVGTASVLANADGGVTFGGFVGRHATDGHTRYRAMVVAQYDATGAGPEGPPAGEVPASPLPPVRSDAVREPFTIEVGGFTIDYVIDTVGRPGVSIRAGGGITPGANEPHDDVVRISRSTSVRWGIDFRLNGETWTLDAEKVGPRPSWGLDAGGGDDRIEVTFGRQDMHDDHWLFSGFSINGGDGDDTLVNGDVNASLAGGKGDDVLRGGAANDSLAGDEGIDQLYGGPGDDTLRAGVSYTPGQGGHAPLEPGEVYEGGPGDDTLVTAEGARPLLAPGETAPDPDPEPLPYPGPPVYQPEPLPPAEDGPVVTAAFSGKRTVRGGKAYTFRVTYAAPAGNQVDRSSLGNGDVTVSGPGGFSAPATLVGAAVRRRGSVVVARYRVAAPGGAFDAADNGDYTVRLGAAAVSASATRTQASDASFTVSTTAEQDLATFQVAAKARRRPGGATGALLSA